MINVLIPAMGESLFFRDSYFPKPMIEVGGQTMLEKVVYNYSGLNKKHFIFIFSQKDCAEFHLDDSARILTQPETDILVLEGRTAGALCTCLMAIELIENEKALFIANCDQIIDVDYNKVLEYFDKDKADAGVISFESIHPRWSYARVTDGEVTEVAEKRPLSKNAIAGFYYFKHGSDFIHAAEKVVLKDNSINGQFYISSSLNEIILMGKRVSMYKIDKNNYHSFYSPQKIQEYEMAMQEKIKI